MSVVVDRAVDRSPAVRRSRAKAAEQQRSMVDAARRLIAEKDGGFTTQELIKEAGVALQTFYRHFGGKDQLLLAVIEDLVAERVADLEAAARAIDDPVERLRWYVTDAVHALQTGGAAAYITVEHWRLHQQFPDEMARADQPFADLVERELRAATARGLLSSEDPHRDAWFTMKLAQSVFHHYAFVTPRDPVDVIADQLWSFCLAAFGG